MGGEGEAFNTFKHELVLVGGTECWRNRQKRMRHMGAI
jgi:hypothetical protein